MLTKFIDYLAQKPVILDFLRRVLENNHQGEKKVITVELPNRESLRVLDLGCGTGVFSPLFGRDYVGVDISKKYIEYARSHYDKKFYVMDAKKLDFPDDYFDIIWVNGVLHHLDDASVRLILREMKRVLKLNGRAVIMEDVPAKKLISKFIRSLDVGDYIRAPQAYKELFSEQFNIKKQYPLRTGVCDYESFVLTLT